MNTFKSTISDVLKSNNLKGRIRKMPSDNNYMVTFDAWADYTTASKVFDDERFFKVGDGSMLTLYIEPAYSGVIPTSQKKLEAELDKSFKARKKDAPKMQALTRAYFNMRNVKSVNGKSVNEFTKIGWASWLYAFEIMKNQETVSENFSY